MPGTKIINVLRDDKLEDILHIFRSTPAEEVIFVLPKRARAFSDEASFAALAEESQELSKGVLILSENPEINAIASSYDLGILTSEDSDKPKSIGSNIFRPPEFRALRVHLWRGWYSPLRFSPPRK